MKPQNADLILLKGAPGVGKSTAARLIAEHFPSGARIEVDTLRQMVIAVDWKNQQEHRTLLTISAKLAAHFIRAGYAPVILVDTFSGDKVEGFLEAFRVELAEVRVCVCSLHASEETLHDRVLNREVGGFRDLPISTRINAEVVRDAKPSETIIDTTGLSPPDVAQAILAAVRIA